ncbi:MAG: right-handed parallel beta-helix repeat-containing protein, partial [Candidatus Hodarchaeota archaeon]
MSYSKRIFCSLLVGSLLLVLMSSNGYSLFQPAEGRHLESVPKIDAKNNSILQVYTFNESITVNNDSDLATIASSGVGSANDPYIITGWNITSSLTDGIYILGTTKYFRIENCSVCDCLRGIVVRNVASGTVTITNNTCTNNTEFGIHIVDSDFSNITDNTCNNNGNSGISLTFSDSSLLNNNSCNHNYVDGIKIRGSSSSTITNNICYDNRFNGISLDSSGSSLLINNTCIGHY